MSDDGGTHGQAGPVGDTDGGNGGSGGEFDLSGSGARTLKVEDPTWIGDIPLLGRLGSGGMGRVYLGLLDGEYAAVKQVHPHFAEDAMFLRRFGRELDNLARLPSDVSAPLLASDREARPPWFATAYVPGITLSQALDLSGGPLPVPAVWRLLRHLAAGLHEVHARETVHRDLKPSNVMLTEDGVTLIDFGIARAAEQSRLTGTGMAVGTPAYMSPEQAAAGKDLTPATDVFALGSLVAYAATGQPPFGEGSGNDVLHRIVHSGPELDALRERDAELAELVTACLDKDPAARPTARELLDLAMAHSPEAALGWPVAVQDRLVARAAFAARPRPRPEELPARTELPLNAAALPEAPTEREPGRAPDGKPADRPEPARRRRRTLLVVVPVLLAAGTPLALQLIPDSSPATGAAGPRPTASAPPASGTPATATSPPTHSATPRGGAKPSTPATKSPGSSGGTSPATSTAGSGTGGSTSTTGSTSGGSAQGTTSPASPPASTGAPTGPHAYQNARTGTCLTSAGLGNSLVLGSCSGDAAQWTMTPVSGGYHLVNKATSSCLQADMFNTAAGLAGCDSTQGVLTWSPGTGGTFSDAYDGRCLYIATLAGAPTQLGTTPCTGAPAQTWHRQ